MSDCTSCERMAKAENSIDNLEREAKSMSDKLDRLQYWIMTTAAGIGVTLIILLFKGAR